MDLELILRCKVKIIAFFIFIIVALCGCDLKAEQYPSQIAKEWYCDAPPFSLIYFEDNQGRKAENEVLEWNDKTIYVDITFGLGDYCVFPIDSNRYEDRLFTGTWKYIDDNLVLYIDEDFIFEEQYTELIFSPLNGIP